MTSRLTKRVELVLQAEQRNRSARSGDRLAALERKIDNMTQRGIIPASEFNLSQSSSYPVRSFLKA